MPGKYWRASEIATLRAVYPQEGADEVARRLGRSARAVRWKAMKLQLRHGSRWSAADDETLALFYGVEPSESLCRMLGRSLNALHSRAWFLGLTRSGGAL